MRYFPYGLAIVLICASLFVNCSPKARTLENPIVQQLELGRAQGKASFDHTVFDRLLAKHARTDDGRMDYAGLQKDRAQLDAYLATLATADVEQLNEPEQLALLLNAYNGYTLSLILDHYPHVASIKDLEDPWTTPHYKIAGQTLSLDDIEHGLIRPIYKDPRVHFAVNCASIGCPPLQDMAYSGEKVEKQLEFAAHAVLNNPEFVSVHGEEVRITPVMKWFNTDFTSKNFSPSTKTVPEFVALYNKEIAALLKKNDDPSVRFIDYDWALNDISK